MLTLFPPGADVARRQSDDCCEHANDVQGGLRAPTGTAWLLVEAIEIAERFGCRVVETELDGESNHVRWGRGGRRLWVDLNDSPEKRLSAIADALRGEPGLAFVDMSPELAAYLSPRRAA